MSHADASPLSGYNSLQDPHLRGYFSNGRMRKHLRKAGLVSRRGVIISEQTYRLNNARREHKKHVRDLMAQAIVHKTLDMERYRQVEIRKKLEEIAKMELVRKIKSERDRKGDEDVLPFLSPRRPSSSSGRGRSRPTSGAPVSRRRPKSAPGTSATGRGIKDNDEDENVLYMDEDGRIVDGPEYPKDQIDSKHLYPLNRRALHDYHVNVNQAGGTLKDPSPYTLPQNSLYAPEPPSKPRQAPRRAKSASYGQMSQRPQSSKKRQPLHRQEPPMAHATPVHSNAVMKFKYRGVAQKLKGEAEDPRVEIVVEQQHCGGNTLTVFKGLVYPGETFEFVSKRHRGFPLGLTLYVNGRSDIVLSSCCERKHRTGMKLGQFVAAGVDGAPPCYKCKVMKELRVKDRRRKASEKQRKNDQNPDVIVHVQGEGEAEEEYADDFENDNGSTKTDVSNESSRSSSRQSSARRSSSSDSKDRRTPSPERKRSPSPAKSRSIDSDSDPEPPKREGKSLKTNNYSSDEFESEDSDSARELPSKRNYP